MKIIVFREGQGGHSDRSGYCRQVAEAKSGGSPPHLAGAYVVGVRPGAGLDLAYAMGLYARLVETQRVADFGSSSDS